MASYLEPFVLTSLESLRHGNRAVRDRAFGSGSLELPWAADHGERHSIYERGAARECSHHDSGFNRRALCGFFRAGLSGERVYIVHEVGTTRGSHGREPTRDESIRDYEGRAGLLDVSHADRRDRSIYQRRNSLVDDCCLSDPTVRRLL